MSTSAILPMCQRLGVINAYVSMSRWHWCLRVNALTTGTHCNIDSLTNMMGGSHPYPTCQVGPTRPTPPLPHLSGGSYPPYPTCQVGPTHPHPLPHLPGGSHPPPCGSHMSYEQGKYFSQNMHPGGFELKTSNILVIHHPLPLHHQITCVKQCFQSIICLIESVGPGTI
jgi:hypothetical protein